MGDVLLITTDSPTEALAWARRHCAEDRVSVLAFGGPEGERPLPERWRWLRAADLLDAEALRTDFLAFVDAWPRRRLAGGKSFDQMFRHPNGYSVWWTGPGVERHPDNGVFPKLKTLWICDRAIRSESPRRVLIHTRQADLAWGLASRLRRGGLEYRFLPGSVDQTCSPWGGRLWWLAASGALLLRWPGSVLVRALLARLLIGRQRETPQQRQTAAVVFASAMFPYFHIDRGQITVSFWQELCEALQKTAAGVRLRFLPHIGVKVRFRGYRMILGLYHTSWPLLRRLEGAAPTRARYPAWGAQLRSAPGHLAALMRYFRLEMTRDFRNSFLFAGADVAAVYVPRLRRAVMRMGIWAQTVGAIVQSLRAVGNVKAVLVAEEMYESGMLDIAAAGELGIPTVGVQHGTIFPMHMIYTLPPGQVENAPTTDYFAAHGPYAKETVSVYGSFPAERVWITGGSKFDGLTNNRSDVSAVRRHLDLPQDKRIVLLTTQHYRWFLQAAEAVFEATKDDAGCLVCLKTHPRDFPLEVYQEIARRVGADNVRFLDRQFGELLTACDVLISGSSTTVMEAILAGRRTICVNFSDEPDRYPYVADGGSIGARSCEQIRVALKRVLSEEDREEFEAGRERFLRRHAGPSAEGLAADLLARRIVGLCREQ